MKKGETYLGSVPKSHGKRRKSKKTVLLDGKGNTKQTGDIYQECMTFG